MQYILRSLCKKAPCDIFYVSLSSSVVVGAMADRRPLVGRGRAGRCVVRLAFGGGELRAPSQAAVLFHTSTKSISWSAARIFLSTQTDSRIIMLKKSKTYSTYSTYNHNNKHPGYFCPVFTDAFIHLYIHPSIHPSIHESASRRTVARFSHIHHSRMFFGSVWTK
jgi:hypothetical protein